MHRRLLPLVLVLCAGILPVPGIAHAETEGASVDKTGWWSRANTATGTPAGPVTVPPPPGIPAGDLAVSGGGGTETALTAIGIQPAAEGPIERFTLTVVEDPDATGNQGAASAAIDACPITSFWAGGENGEWETRPEHDCELASVPGVRAEDGRWTFDLTPIGELWFDPFGTIRADGVVLVPSPDSDGFQAVFLGGEAIEVVLAVEQPADDDFTPTIPEDVPPDVGLSSGPTGGGASIFSPPVVSRPPTTLPRPTLAPTTTVAPPTAPDTDLPLAGAPETTVEPGATRTGQLLGNLPPAAMAGGVPAVLAILFAMSYWLGPAGQPTATASRQRGVSRALEARARAARGI